MSKYKQVYNDIKGKIDTRFYKRNTELPSENDLVREYGYSKDTIRKALSLLELDGYIQKIKMNYTTTWTLNLISNSVTKGLEKISSATNFLTERMSKLGDCIKRVQAIDLMAIENSVQNVKNGIQSFTDLAVKNESALAEVSAITGVYR